MSESPGAVVLVVDPASGRVAEPHDASAPSVAATDLAVVRGDGVFETIGVTAGIPRDVDGHLARLARSARMLELAGPEDGAWRRAIDRAAREVVGAPRASVRLVLSRGLDGGRATAWVTAAPEEERAAAPLAVVTLDRGYDSRVPQRAPWLLAGAKTLSYAVHTAALREARRRGADDAVFVTSDGLVLEAPTATVVLAERGTLVTPDRSIGVLPGTTQRLVFDALAAEGVRVRTEDVTVERLRAADAIWLTSSVRLVAPVARLDDVAVPLDDGLTRRMTEAALGRRVVPAASGAE